MNAPRFIAVLAVLTLGPGAAVTLAAAGLEDASNSAGLVLVRPDRIVDEPGTGSPPLPAGQDGDGYPDTDETVDLSVVLSNKSGQSLTGVTVRLWSLDPKVGCISNSIVLFGTVAPGANVPSSTPFRFRVSPNADRGGVAPPVACITGSCSNGAGKCSVAGECARTAVQAYAARFYATVTADQLPAAGEVDGFDIELDLNSTTAVKATSTFTEGFEGGTVNMVLLDLDGGIATNTLSDGRRCQYSDPDFVNSDAFGDTECYLGFAGSGSSNDWHTHETTEADGGRAFQGVRSLHYGIHLGGVGMDTYGLSQLDAIRLKNPINLSARVCRDDPSTDKRACNSAADCVGFGGGPCVSASPELSFKQQISTMDSRSLGVQSGEAIDRAVVQAQFFAAGAAWQNVAPYQNVYDVKGSDGISNCTFDPIDDGNTEDDYFQPGDPDRRYGPSSTCYPEFVFSYLGDTDNAFDPANIGRASDGPGLQGSLGLGTWVESKFDLSRFRGRQIRIRWLLTSLKVSEVPTWQSLFMFNPNPGDDGWYVDDVRVTGTLGTSTPTASLDSADRSSLPACAGACSSLNASLIATPDPSPAPGYPINLSASSSAADSCPGGELSYEFWNDVDANGVLGDAPDWVFLGPGSTSELNVKPHASSAYGVRVRCTTSPPCSDDATLTVAVECPPPATYSPYAWWTSLRGFSRFDLGFIRYAGAVGDVVRGSLSTLRSTGAFGGETCLFNDQTMLYVDNGEMPPAGDGFYYLTRGSEPTCAEPPTYRTYSPTENPGDPSKRDDEITACPAP